jgi:hypothetical protein
MRTRSQCAVLVLALSLLSAACAGEAGKTEPAEPRETGTTAAPSPEPKTPADVLDSAEKAMAGQNGWTFAVTGKEGLVTQGQANSASYKATVQRTQKPDALHSMGVTTSKGDDRSEEIFVIGGTAYLKEASQGWKHGPVTDPDMQSKVEDPLGALEAFRTYLRNPADGVTLTTRPGQVQLQVRASSKRFPEMQGRDFMQKVRLELDPTLKQLEKAGVSVNEKQLTLSHLEETLILDPATHQIVSHRLQFSVVIPYGKDGITYTQDVQEHSHGVFGGEIQLPAGVR